MIEEYELNDISEVGSIKIGNGVVAELTFNIQVNDYYVEIGNPIVSAAK
jgi:hypothetical protein